MLAWGLVGRTASGEISLFPIEDLQPTQSNVGMREVQFKAEKIAAMKKKEREAFLLDNPVPVIIGPGDIHYLIDHHHLSRALLEIGKKNVYTRVVADWSQLSKSEFWKAMKKHKYVYLKNKKGRNLDPEDLPKRVADLGDDPYRSLASSVRRKGGFEKVPTPFAEFEWALFFRERLELKSSESQTSYEKTVEKAVELAELRKAHKLPGFRARCENLF